MLADVFGGDVEQLGHLRLRQPHGLTVSAQLDAAEAVLGGVEDQAAHAPVASGAGSSCCIRPFLWDLSTARRPASAVIRLSMDVRKSAMRSCSSRLGTANR